MVCGPRHCPGIWKTTVKKCAAIWHLDYWPILWHSPALLWTAFLRLFCQLAPAYVSTWGWNQLWEEWRTLSFSHPSLPPPSQALGGTSNYGCISSVVSGLLDPMIPWSNLLLAAALWFHFPPSGSGFWLLVIPRFLSTLRDRRFLLIVSFNTFVTSPHY